MATDIFTANPSLPNPRYVRRWQVMESWRLVGISLVWLGYIVIVISPSLELDFRDTWKENLIALAIVILGSIFIWLIN